MNNFWEYLESLSFVGLVINRPCTPKEFNGRYRPVVNNTVIKPKNIHDLKNDTEYIKLKYSILGIRYWSTGNGLQIAGPNHAVNQYSKIRKEKFSWRICPEVIK